MGRFHVKKQDTFIDMTPMSDVMVLLLTFFMLTATFTKEEPVKVNVPGSVSDIKIPENNLLTIFVSPQGKVFMNMDNPTAQKAMAQNLVDNKKLDLNSAQLKLCTVEVELLVVHKVLCHCLLCSGVVHVHEHLSLGRNKDGKQIILRDFNVRDRSGHVHFDRFFLGERGSKHKEGKQQDHDVTHRGHVDECVLFFYMKTSHCFGVTCL